MKFRPLCLLLGLLAGRLQATLPQAIIADSTGNVWQVEVAANETDQARGLMYRAYLLPWQGMLFVFEKEAPLHFWMKNTWLTLDIRFYDRDGYLVQRYPFAAPCLQSHCPIYTSENKAQYVLETRSQLRPQSVGKFSIYLPKAK